MSSPTSELSVLEVNVLCTVVSAPESTATEIAEIVETAYGVDLPRSRVYNHVSRLAALGLVEKSDPRGALGKAITPTTEGQELVDDEYGWLVEQLRSTDPA